MQGISFPKNSQVGPTRNRFTSTIYYLWWLGSSYLPTMYKNMYIPISWSVFCCTTFMMMILITGFPFSSVNNITEDLLSLLAVTFVGMVYISIRNFTPPVCPSTFWILSPPTSLSWMLKLEWIKHCKHFDPLPRFGQSYSYPCQSILALLTQSLHPNTPSPRIFHFTYCTYFCKWISTSN